ncbi:MAG: NAD(P)-dependent oxidoreductase [Chloroflexi bacterium]|nr:NAD(P)-dependent oxidoreductase [Chloroflexota bacterium]
MRVLITGGTGLIGKTTCEHLLAKGWQVRSLDIATRQEPAAVEHLVGDILHFDTLVEAMNGCDAVVHLAAIRAPVLARASSVFEVNVAGTFNVFEAAARAGIRRVVQASSINAFGFYYGTVDRIIRYLPVDEEHPIFTTDPYSFSKQVDEQIGDYFWRRDGISSVAMRFPAVLAPDYSARPEVQSRRTSSRQLIDELSRLPEALLAEQMHEAREYDKWFRAQRPMDYHPENAILSDLIEKMSPLSRMYQLDRPNFWAALDVRDAAHAIELGLTAEYEGAHPLFINDRDNSLGYDAQTLARLFYPDVTEYRKTLAGTAALVCNTRAKLLIGYEPKYSVVNAGQPHN